MVKSLKDKALSCIDFVCAHRPTNKPLSVSKSRFIYRCSHVAREGKKCSHPKWKEDVLDFYEEHVNG